jgi:hypothetical protein
LCLSEAMQLQLRDSDRPRLQPRIRHGQNHGGQNNRRRGCACTSRYLPPSPMILSRHYFVSRRPPRTAGLTAGLDRPGIPGFPHPRITLSTARNSCVDLNSCGAEFRVCGPKRVRGRFSGCGGWKWC